MESILDFTILFDCFQLRFHVSPSRRPFIGHLSSAVLSVGNQILNQKIKGIFAYTTRCSGGGKIGVKNHLRHSFHSAYFERKLYNVGFRIFDFIYSWNIFYVY